MKNRTTFRVILLLAFLLSACGKNTTVVPTISISEVYTAIAQTLDVQTPETISQVTPSPVPTQAPLDTLIAASTPKEILYTQTMYAPTGCDNSIFVSDVTIPDYTELTAGQVFTKTWLFQNTGTCTWNTNYEITYYSGDSMEGESTPIGKYIQPGEQAEVSVSLTAPDTAGQYKGYWCMSNDNGEDFGETVFVVIVVSDDPTSTPTSTATYTASPTETPTDTPTFTPTLTNTPTETSVPATEAPPVSTSEETPTVEAESGS